MSGDLMKIKIEEAQKVIDAKKEQVAAGKYRQHYHFMGQVGWINDPNGLIYYKGYYHCFYQYNPYGSFWDKMHWGHAISKDLLHWEYLPLALAPSEFYETHTKGGCFSGSAIEYDGKLYIMYTAHSSSENGDIQRQCLAWSEDGIHFEKYEGNPVILPPEGVKPDDFRDPKIWEHDGSYYMICGAKRGDRSQVLIYRSEDFFHWDFFNVMYESQGEWGEMWECPDIFPLGNRYVLTGSPFKAGDHTAVYIVGNFDYETGKFCPLVSEEMDWGLDYYAPQSFSSPDGRRITIAWANEWDWMPQFKDWGPTYQEGWCGYYALPREIRLTSDDHLQFVPIRELEDLRTNPYQADLISVEEKPVLLKAGDGISCEMKFEIDLEETTAKQVELWLRVGEGKKTVCLFDLEKGELSVDRKESDGWSRGMSKSILSTEGKDILDLHIFMDQSSLEIFTQDYRNNHTNNVFAGDAQNQIFIKTSGGKAVIRNYESYGMEECFRR